MAELSFLHGKDDLGEEKGEIKVNQKYEKRTDLAIEVRESFPQDNVEVEGVVLTEERRARGNLKVTTVEIKNENVLIFYDIH